MNPHVRSKSRQDMKTLRTKLVRNFEEMQRAIRALQKKSPGIQLVFRGQTSLRGGSLRPSISRSGNAAQEYRAKQMTLFQKQVTANLYQSLRAYMKWEAKRARRTTKAAPVSSDPVPAHNRTLDSHVQAIIQHYGGRSNYVDVTKAISVALWFAHHRWVQPRDGLPFLPDELESLTGQPDKFGAFPSFDVAWYEPAWTRESRKFGYLFVIKPTSPEAGTNRPLHGTFIDLMPNLFATRIMRQKAGLIYCDPAHAEQGELGAFVQRVFRFELPLAGAPRMAIKATTLSLFPPPARDFTYRDLIQTLAFREDLNAPWLYRRELPIPEYYNSFDDFGNSATWRDFRSNDRYLWRRMMFRELCKATGAALECVLDDHPHHVREALPIITPSLYGIPLTPDEPVELGDSGKGVFLEFDFRQSYLYREPLDEGQPAIGVWILRSGQDYWCRLFTGKFIEARLKLSAFPDYLFKLEDFQRPSLSWTADIRIQTRDWLIQSLALLRDINTGKRKLQPAGTPPYFVISDDRDPGLAARMPDE